jgi:hypothetical protein
MKKRIAIGAVALGLLVVSVGSARAVEYTNTTTMPKDRMEARKDVMIQNAENRQEMRQERRDTVLENIANRVENRFTMHEERLQNWIDRATAHSEKMAANGKDTTKITTAIDAATTSLVNATKLGDDAVAKLRAVTPEAWAEQKADALAAKEAVKKAQVAYAQVIKDMQKVVQALKTTAKE